MLLSSLAGDEAGVDGAGVKVELRAARIPFIGSIAHHYWLVVHDAGGSQRWEVWHRRDSGGESWGHLHRNLMAFDGGVGNGPSWVTRTWHDEAASRLARRLAAAPDRYPWCERYLSWPGPNSNTFAAWAIGDAGALGWQGLGKHYARLEPLDDRLPGPTDDRFVCARSTVS